MFLFSEGSGQWSSRCGGYLLQCNAFALSKGEARLLFLLGLALVACTGLWRCDSSASAGFLLLIYILSKLQVALQSGHLVREGGKFRLPIGRQPPDVVVDVGSVRVIIQCELQKLVNSERGFGILYSLLASCVRPV